MDLLIPARKHSPANPEFCRKSARQAHKKSASVEVEDDSGCKWQFTTFSLKLIPNPLAHLDPDQANQCLVEGGQYSQTARVIIEPDSGRWLCQVSARQENEALLSDGCAVAPPGYGQLQVSPGCSCLFRTMEGLPEVEKAQGVCEVRGDAGKTLGWNRVILLTRQQSEPGPGRRRRNKIRW